ncbi:MAG TPA: hypothetical protein VHB22_00015, partial [Hyphomicrobium sp.]|nr:hypothetical protein [Hyphomicrobium sp.]
LLISGSKVRVLHHPPNARKIIVPTPGRSERHMSVVVRGDGVAYVLADDATYSEANLRADKPTA